MDLRMWQQFILHPSAYCRPFVDYSQTETADILDWYTDAAKSVNLGCGGHCNLQWSFAAWDRKFLMQKDPSIEYLELYAVTVSIMLWLTKFPHRTIILFCDNQSIVHMINGSTLNCRNCMVLICLIVLQAMKCTQLSKLNSFAHETIKKLMQFPERNLTCTIN